MSVLHIMAGRREACRRPCCKKVFAWRLGVFSLSFLVAFSGSCLSYLRCCVLQSGIFSCRYFPCLFTLSLPSVHCCFSCSCVLTEHGSHTLDILKRIETVNYLYMRNLYSFWRGIGAGRTNKKSKTQACLLSASMHVARNVSIVCCAGILKVIIIQTRCQFPQYFPQETKV